MKKITRLSIVKRNENGNFFWTPTVYNYSHIAWHAWPVPCHAEVMTCHVIAVISLVCHKIWYGKRKPGVSDQTYFPSFPPPPSLTRMRTRKNTYGWLARLLTNSRGPSTEPCGTLDSTDREGELQTSMLMN